MREEMFVETDKKHFASSLFITRSVKRVNSDERVICINKYQVT